MWSFTTSLLVGTFMVLGSMLMPGIASAKMIKMGIIRVPAPFAIEQEKGFMDEMKKLGYINGRNIEIVSKVVGARVEEFPVNAAVAKKMIQDEGLDILVTMGTQASQPVWPAIKTMGIPMVFAGVTFPIDAGLIKDFDVPTGENMTGISYGISPKTRLTLLRKMFPDTNKYHRLAFVYCGTVPQEILYARYLTELKDNTSGWKMEYIDLYNYETKQPDTKLLMRKLKETQPDAVIGWFSLDQLSADTAQFQQLLQSYGKPIVAITGQAVDNGAIGGILTDHIALGAQHAVMVDRILKGESAATIPPEQAKRFQIELNFKQAKLLGIEFPADIVSSATRRVVK